MKFRGKTAATIYGKSKAYSFYRVSAYVAGKRRLSSHQTYAEAAAAAERLVRDIASGSQAAALSAAQASDALAALQRLDAYRQQSGKTVSLLAVVSEYAEAAVKLTGRTLADAVDGYLGTMANVRRVDLSAAVEQFITSRHGKTLAKDGKRAALSLEYEKHVCRWLRQFSGTLPNTAVCDVSKTMLDVHLNGFGALSPKSRNDKRAVIAMFLKWSVRQDYLMPTHRLAEADGLQREAYQPEAIEFYRPSELHKLLSACQAPENKDLLPIVALGGLAGLRVEEIARLSWQDVWRVPGHVEITATKSKTRQRRLVTVCPSLAQWLQPFRERTGPIWTKRKVQLHIALAKLRESLKLPMRRNGLRHGFVTYHYALHQNENQTAAEAGNSPAMIHGHYKGLATQAEAKRWFDVAPMQAENIIQFVEQATP